MGHLRPRTALRSNWTYRDRDARVQGRRAPMANSGVGRGRTDGLDELPADFHALHTVLQWLRLGLLRQTRALPVALRAGGDVDHQSGAEPDLAAAFPVRPGGMGVAVADVLETPAHAGMKVARKTSPPRHKDTKKSFLSP